MEVFELNRRLHPEERFWTFLGFDRTPPPEISPTPFESWEMVIANVRPNLNAYPVESIDIARL